VRRLVLDELGNFIDSESGRILLAAASWLKTFMMQIAIPVGRARPCFVPEMAACSRRTQPRCSAARQLSGRFQLRHTLGLFDPPGQHWERATVVLSWRTITKPAATSSRTCCSSSTTAASDSATHGWPSSTSHGGCTTRLTQAALDEEFDRALQTVRETVQNAIVEKQHELADGDCLPVNPRALR
jgi:hypothetical protein